MFVLRLPIIHGLIRRRLLINFRADPRVVQKTLPEGFTPKLFKGNAIVGVCMIRLEQMRPSGVSAALGLTSENAAHRVAVEWVNSNGVTEEGVYIIQRHTDSKVVALTGGRLFPGEHQHARFWVKDDGSSISLTMDSTDGAVSVVVNGRTSDMIQSESCFSSLAEASAYFEAGCVGYSAARNLSCLDGMKLQIERWEIEPFEVTTVRSSYFEREDLFPRGSIEFDHGLIMRNIFHQWQSLPSPSFR